MSNDEIIYQNKDYIYYNNDNISNSENTNLNAFTNIISSKSSLYITNQKHSKYLKIKLSSIKKILSNGQIDPKKYILFFSYKDASPKSIINKRKKENNINEETKEEDEEESSLSIKRDEQPKNQEIINKDKNPIALDVKNKNENIFDPKLPLLNTKINNNFSNIENIPKKYINFILCYNTVTISIDLLKCFYIILFLCGLFNFLYFLEILFEIYIFKNFSSSDNLYHIIYFPLAILLIITGLYGNQKINDNIYDDEICMCLTHICFISPIFSFILSRISSVNILAKNIIIDFLINFIPCLFAFLCIFILKEFERIKISEKNILQHS